jgi:hypothetical protein
MGLLQDALRPLYFQRPQGLHTRRERVQDLRHAAFAYPALGAPLGVSMIFGIIIEESVFDQASYDKAVAEAVRNSGLEGGEGRQEVPCP